MLYKDIGKWWQKYIPVSGKFLLRNANYYSLEHTSQLVI